MLVIIKTNRENAGKSQKKLYRKYRANDGDFEEISKLNQAVEELFQKGFITRETETFGTQLKCIYLMDERIQEIERYLTDQYGYVPKDRKLEKLQELVDKYQNTSSICKKECAILAECVESRKIPKNIEELDDVLKAVAFIEKNQEDLYIREASMKIYGDSKFLKMKHCSRSAVSCGNIQIEIRMMNYWMRFCWTIILPKNRRSFVSREM